MKLATHPLLDRLAANYVLGVMRRGPRRRLEAAMCGSGAVQAAIDAWSDRLHLLSRIESDIEASPELYGRIERRLGFAPEDRVAGASSATSRRARRWSWLRPAAGFAFGVLLTSTVVVLQRPAYETLTTPSPAPAVQGQTLHVLFAPGTTVEQARAALRSVDAAIVGGPTELGLFTLALPQGRPLQPALDTLRRQAGVRFAEPASAPAAPR